MGMITIRALEKQDLAGVRDLECGLFFDAWSMSALTDWKKSLGAKGVCVLDDGLDDVMVGYVLTQMLFDEIEVLRVGVAMDRQGYGIGWRMMTHLLDNALNDGARRAFLEVRADNAAAIRLYQKLGFYQVALRRGYYRTDVGAFDALVLEKSLG